MRALITAAALLTIAALLWFWIHREGAERRAIVDLPADQRAEVYRREIASFRALCGAAPRTDALEGECHRRAELLLAFEECDEGCDEQSPLSEDDVHGRRSFS